MEVRCLGRFKIKVRIGRTARVTLGIRVRFAVTDGVGFQCYSHIVGYG